MKPDYPALQFWLIIFNALVTAIFAGYSWWMNREKVTNRRFTTLESQVKDMVGKPELSKIKEARDAELAGVRKSLDNIPACCQSHALMDTRVSGHNDRLGQHKELITKIEAEFKFLPKKHDLEAVYDRVNKVSEQMADLRSEVGKIAGTLPGLTHITDMMNEFLLRQGGKN
jgi:DNA repair ATPase RecN